ncbi:siderophore-interacting protein [Streptomyces sp. RKCA744]|uniref:siderophore-interacting protein n=1 Tax=Streptomyces sp. RKCA744 TaxID=2959340 RepID=UPI00209F78A0|nr:siderophore-interacting protein [Streptomyces sp. RKCA744]MCO8307175.1 siderophore-interacting protein [Streptomyces sp. RKCA744]
MADRPARRTRTPHRAQVVRTDRLTPHMVRVVLGGDGLADFHAGEWTDHYIKLLFPSGGATYPEPFDLERIRAEFPRDQWPVTRTYTVRAWDPAARELTVDFVTHGDEGLAGPWAARVRPGEEIFFMGPGGAYAPSTDADWHLLAGDESALPAIAAALERLAATASRDGGAAGAPVHTFIEVADETEELKLTVPDGVEVSWLHRGGAPVGEALVAAVRELEFPDGQVHAFVHGEAGFVKEIRRHLRVDRQIPREWLSISGYWRRGHDEDRWQASKREWNRQVEAEQEGAEPGGVAA